MLFTEVKIQLIADGYDLKIGLSHGRKGFKEPLVLDHMEPLRPFVDAEILKLVLKDEFSPSDFVVTNEGFCRLNPQLAKVICQMVSARVNLSRTTN